MCLAVVLSWSFCQAHGQSVAAAPELPPGAKTLLNLAYIDDDEMHHKLNLYLPASGTNLPLIIWIHGGAWFMGDKESPPGQGFLRHGFALASLDYRLSQEAKFPAQLTDCKAAIRWLRVHAAEHGIDPNRIGVWGASAGGHLVALLGTTGGVKDFDVGDNLGVSSRVQAVCDWYGPSDFSQITNFPSTIAHGAADSPEAKLLGGAIGQNPDKVQRANPIHYITKDAPPFLIMHGEKDMDVPLNQSQLLADALKQAGVPVMFHVVPGAGHGGPEFRQQEEVDRLFLFFAKTLKVKGD